jgi:hypothetical protein
MAIKSLFIALGISISAVIAADSVGEKNGEQNPGLSVASSVGLTLLSTTVEEDIDSNASLRQWNSIGEKDIDPNADLSLLISAYRTSANDQTMMNLRLYLHSLQAEIYYLVNLGDFAEATVKVESATSLLDPIFESMSDEQRQSVGSKTLKIIKEFMQICMPNV